MTVMSAGRNVGGVSDRALLIHEQEHDDWIHSLSVKFDGNQCRSRMGNCRIGYAPRAVHLWDSICRRGSQREGG